MDASALWKTIISKANISDFEIKTIPQVKGIPLWFLVAVEGGSLIIKKAKVNSPSVKLTAERKISYKDFEFVYSYYERWLNGGPGIRHEVSRKSRNTAYIFALIAEAKKIQV